VKIYEVGGAVRDELLGLPVKDRDYVVVGATPEEMIGLGYRPVGRDFPVFLHPETHEEHALARTERKIARGYHGFEFYSAPDVSLEDDLARRDLTINAIARDEDGTLIDPFNGTEDLSAGILRHVGPAFVEDPVRILRVARFAARFGFDIAPETLDLMRTMVESGEVDALVAERVWQELARGLMEKRPSRMLEVLQEIGALRKVAPEIAALFADPQQAQSALDALDAAAEADAPLEVRFAALARALDPYAVDGLAQRLKLPASVSDLALLAARHANTIQDAEELDGESVLELLNAADAWRRPDRFRDLLKAAGAGHKAVSGLQKAREAAAAVDAGAIAKAAGRSSDIKQRVNAARLDAIRAALSSS
jgi:tRNA nucleotidyltransferase (CCA-adding enzyme)